MLHILRELLNRRRLRDRSGIYCFNFHQVAEVFDPRIHMRGTFTSMRTFERYIRHFKSDFDILSVSAAIELQRGKDYKGKYACITFDDGDAGIENVINYLLSEAVPASFYLNSAYIGTDYIDPFRVANYLMHDGGSVVSSEKLIQLTRTLRRTMIRAEFENAREELRNLRQSIPSGELASHVSRDYLQRVDSPLVAFGLHGHEHDRFILLDYSEQLKSLSLNIEFVAQLKGYVPVFAIPFGRPWDWNGVTIDVCNDLGLSFMFANGGVNTGDEVGLRRIPADDRNLLLEMRIGYYQ